MPAGRKRSTNEQEIVLDYVMSFRSVQIREFLEQHQLPKSGTKADLRERITRALTDEALEYCALIAWLDTIEPWGKQHVCLFDGPEGEAHRRWRDAKWVVSHLRSGGLTKYLNAHVPLALPAELSLSSIHHTDDTVRITAVERREYWERNEDLDEMRTLPPSIEVEYRAFVHHIKRGLVILEWNLVANTAMLQISQLPSGTRYEHVVERFQKLLSPWFDFNLFNLIDVSRSIIRLHEREEAGTPEARSHSLDYASLGGRRLSGRSPSPSDSLLGEAVIDDAMKRVRTRGVGHMGNFYWLPQHRNPQNNNPLRNEVHVLIVGSKGRVAFPTPNTEQDVRYVLSRVRTLSV